MLAGGRAAEAVLLSAELMEESRQFHLDGESARDIAVLHGRALLAINRLSEAESLLAGTADEAKDSPGAALEGRLAHVEIRLRPPGT